MGKRVIKEGVLNKRGNGGGEKVGERERRENVGGKKVGVGDVWAT